jgi:hypothetical protein
VVNIERLHTSWKLTLDRIPDPFGAVSQGLDGCRVRDAEGSRQRAEVFFESVDGLERSVDEPSFGRRQDACVPFFGRGGGCRGSFGEGADLELTPTAQGIDHAPVHLKLDVARRCGEVIADFGKIDLPIRHGLGFGLAVDAQRFGGDLDAEVVVEMVLADAKGCLTNFAASQA